MRVPVLLVLVLAACSPGSEESPRRLPATLDVLVLHGAPDEITPVVFRHGDHSDPAFTGQDLQCTYCHHTLTDEPGSLPTACGTCHPHDPEEGNPPDI